MARRQLGGAIRLQTALVHIAVTDMVRQHPLPVRCQRRGHRYHQGTISGASTTTWMESAVTFHTSFRGTAITLPNTGRGRTPLKVATRCASNLSTSACRWVAVVAFAATVMDLRARQALTTYATRPAQEMPKKCAAGPILTQCGESAQTSGGRRSKRLQLAMTL